MTNKGNPTLKEIAELARVSEATVSRVVNNRPNVHPDTVFRVSDAIRKLNADFGQLRRRFRKTEVKIAGIVIPDMMNPVFPLMMKGIQQVARTHGYNLTVYDSENEPEIEREHLQLLVGSSADGLIWIPVGESYSEGNYGTVRSLSTVLLDRRLEGTDFNSVTCANEDGAYQATRYLLSLGHRDILFVGGPSTISTSNERFSGFRRALEEQSVAFLDENHLQCDFTMTRAYEETIDYLSGTFRATAVFAANDAMAFGVMKALAEAGIDVPGKMSVIGYDDIPYAEFLGLSTVAQPAYEMGRNAMILLIDVLEGRVLESQAISLRPILTIRESCGKL